MREYEQDQEIKNGLKAKIARLEGEITQLTEAWNLAVNPSAMQRRLASISHEGWLVFKKRMEDR